MSPTTHTSYRISPEGRELLAKLAALNGISRTAMLEQLIRREARKALPKGAKMTYDDWKATDDTPEPEPSGWCEKCEHYACDCPCCTEPICDGSEVGLGCDCGKASRHEPRALPKGGGK